MARTEGIELMKDKELLIRIDERLSKIIQLVDDHNKKIDTLCIKVETQNTTLTNHINMHKRDIGIIAIFLTILTIVISVLFKFL